MESPTGRERPPGSLAVNLRAGPVRRAARAACLLAAALAPPAAATTVQGMDIDRIAADAEFIFEGEVIGSRSYRDLRGGAIRTAVTFAVADVVKGDYGAGSLELRFTGGEAEGRAMRVEGLAIPVPGERGIYFVESLSRDLVNPLLGWSQGHFIIVEDDAGARRVHTAGRTPVADVRASSAVPPAIKRPLELGDGAAAVAAGVMAAALSAPALTADEFKARIRAMLED